jgi:hypothetical protein
MRTVRSIVSCACVLTMTLSLLAGSGSADVAPPNAQIVKILRQNDGKHSGVKDRGVWLFNSAKDANESEGRAAGSNSIDFKTESLLVMTQGERPSGGHGVRIDAVLRDGDTVWVLVTENDRGGPTAVMTTPYSAVVVPKIPDNVKLRTEIKIKK